jgi:hypothetical protein
MFRRMTTVLGASLITLVVAGGSASAAIDEGYDQVRTVHKCATAAKKAFHEGRHACQAKSNPQTAERAACYEEVTKEYFRTFEGCYDLAESYGYGDEK